VSAARGRLARPVALPRRGAKSRPRAPAVQAPVVLGGVRRCAEVMGRGDSWQRTAAVVTAFVVAVSFGSGETPKE